MINILNTKKIFSSKGGAGGESKSGEGKSGESKSGAEAKSSENFLDRPHLVAIVRYTEYSENVPGEQDKITEILFSDGNVYKAETFFYEASFGDIETEGKIILERSIVPHQKESKISYLFWEALIMIIIIIKLLKIFIKTHLI